MSLLDQASLVLVPSAIKTGEVLVQKPLPTKFSDETGNYDGNDPQGSANLTFTRASNASRVNADGLIEKVRTNLILQSNTFDTTWAALDLTPTSGQSGYDGSSDAWLLDRTNSNGRIYQTISFTSVGTFSVYAKAGTLNWIRLRDNLGEGSYFDLSGSGAIGSTSSTITPAIQSIGGGWFRCSVSALWNSFNFRIYPADADNDTSGTSGNVYIQNAQLETGLVATDYIPTTTSARSTFAGITVDGTSVPNVPRLDYLGSNCGKLLLEPQRSNLARYSEQMTLWTNGAGTMTANQLASPDGAVNADKFDNLGDCSTFVAAANAAHTFSLFVKQGTSPSASIDMSDGATGDVVTTFTFATKTFSGTTTGGSWTSPSTAYQDYGNGWYRISLTATKGAGSNIGHKIIASGSGYTYVWGAQLEAGAYATSYIPTLSTSVSRVAESASKTGISSLIGQTEGTIYLEADIQKYNESGFYISISNGAVLGSAIYLFQPSSGTLQLLVRNSGNPDAIISILSANWTAGFNKIAIAYTSTTAQVFINGTSKGTTSFIAVPTCSQFTIGSRPDATGNLVGSGPYSQALLFKTRLPNSSLEELTTL